MERACNAMLEEVREVVKSVSAAVPAPAHLQRPSAKWNGSGEYHMFGAI